MAQSKQTERHPGPLPEIRSLDDSVIFRFDPVAGTRGGRLILRCDDRGQVFARIVFPTRDRD
jgi:hypothetical protein